MSAFQYLIRKGYRMGTGHYYPPLSTDEIVANTIYNSDFIKSSLSSVVNLYIVPKLLLLLFEPMYEQNSLLNKFSLNSIGK